MASTRKTTKKSAARPAAAKKKAPARKPAAAKKKPAAAAKKKPAAAAKKKPAAAAKKKPTTAERVYTLDELVARVGGADETGARTLVRGLSDEDLITLGRRVATPRITVDGRRLYGTALDALDRLTPAQRARLPTVTARRLAAAIGALAHGDSLRERRDAELGLRSTRKDAAELDAAIVREEARALRAQLQEVLIDLLGERPEIEAAAGNASTGESLSIALENLVDMLEAKVLDTELRADLQPGSYDERELEAIRTTAKKVRRLDERAAAVQGVAQIPQSEVDLWDGINLTLLDRMVTAFERAHDLEPAVPRLSYQSLRSWTRRAEPTSPGPAPTP
ncbi:MAG: hypothetical protein Q8S73_35750 [Deltaproteobacteria bacterium]|nr:hypothetical protein [Myxococcales bacterium]MDP3219511.1 hypothetical protein [Deltaproteobacteria bacterium]